MHLASLFPFALLPLPPFPQKTISLNRRCYDINVFNIVCSVDLISEMQFTFHFTHCFVCNCRNNLTKYRQFFTYQLLIQWLFKITVVLKKENFNWYSKFWLSQHRCDYAIAIWVHDNFIIVTASHSHVVALFVTFTAVFWQAKSVWKLARSCKL